MQSKRSALGLAFMIGVLVSASCLPPTIQPPEPAAPAEGDFCVDKQTGAGLSYEEAAQIALRSECAHQGRLKDSRACNEDTGTWWIDLDIDRSGCLPACVVDVSGRSAEINWRCTGALPPEGQVALSDRPRTTSAQATEADLLNLIAGNSDLAFDLYQAVRLQEANLFFSPFSISLALAMTYTGAHGVTASQMADTLHYTLPQERLHPAFNRLDLELARRGKGAAGRDGQGFRLHIVNAIWGQEGYGFLAEFLDLLAEHYGAGLRVLDFVGAPEPSRVTINGWVSDQTEGRIQDLIPEGLIDALTRLVLTNAVYFNAAWQHPFPLASTSDGTFTSLDAMQALVPMMVQTERLGYGQGEQYQAVEVPYDGEELSMVILLPDAGAFEIFEASLDAQRVEAIIQGLEGRQVTLTLPKFDFESQLSLADTLAAMGMPDAFGGQADFSGMTGTRELFIAEVLHKAFVAVDEAGTEAAAATAVIMKRLGMSEPPIAVTVDRPFVFLIRDIETSTVIFIGRVVTLPSS